MHPKKRKLIPIAPLEYDLAIHNMEKAAASQTQRILPLQDRPFTIFKYILNDANHLGTRKVGGKHVPNLIINRMIPDICNFPIALMIF